MADEDTDNIVRSTSVDVEDASITCNENKNMPESVNQTSEEPVASNSHGSEEVTDSVALDQNDVLVSHEDCTEILTAGVSTDKDVEDTDHVEMEPGDQFEETMAMLRDLTGDGVCKAVVSCVSSDEQEMEDVELHLTTDAAVPVLDTKLSEQGAGIEVKSDNSLPSLPVSTNDTATPTVSVSESCKATELNLGKRSKGTSGFFDRCIENLRQRGMGLEVNARESKSPELADVSNPNVTASPNSTQLESSSHEVLSNDSSLLSSTRNHRKSRKPTKVSRAHVTGEVEIVAAVRPLRSCCSACSYTCNSESELTQHTSDAHQGVRSATCGPKLFTCKYCKMPEDSRETLRHHLAHHTGNHVFRCFTCPYCSLNSDSMDSMEEHIGSSHPADDFRFEVAQEKVAYLQGMFECPVCSGSYFWKSSFVRHMKIDHKLTDLGSHLESNFPDLPMPTSCRVPRYLFDSFADMLSDTAIVSKDAVSDEGVEDLSDSQSGVHDLSKKLDSQHYPYDSGDFVADHDLDSLDQHDQECRRSWSGTSHGDVGSPGVTSSHVSGMNNSLDWNSPAGIDLTGDSHHLDSDLSNLEAGNSDLSMLSESELAPVARDDVDHMNGFVSHRKMLPVRLKCRLCPFECTRTPNFRRHLAIHQRQSEYAESYRCAYCKFQHRRLNCIRFHLGKYHSNLPARLSRVVAGSVIEVIDADDARLRAKIESSVVESPVIEKKEHSTLNTVSDVRFVENSVSIESPSGSREKRTSKPPKRLSESSDFQLPFANTWRIRRPSSGHPENIVSPHHPSRDAGKIDLPFAESSLRGRLSLPSSRGLGGRPFDDNIAADYLQSDLPPGMIYQKPVKCPRCDFTNRVRINLVRHMKQHHTEDEQERSAAGLTQMSSNGSSCHLGVNASDHNSRMNVKSEPIDDAYDGRKSSVETLLCGNQSSKPDLPAGKSDMYNEASFTRSWKVGQGVEDFTNSGNSLTDKEESFNAYSSALEKELVGRNVEDHGRLVYAAADPSVGFGQSKRLFKCAYCSVSSRWNRRDISLHVLHVHVRRRAFRCRRCGYGTSKSASAVTVHCARTHPGRPAILEDNLTILNAILPMHARPGVVPVAFRRSDGSPVLKLSELESYFGLSQSSSQPDADEKYGTSSKLDTYQSFTNDTYSSDQQAGSGVPLDLSAQLPKETKEPVYNQSELSFSPSANHEMRLDDGNQNSWKYSTHSQNSSVQDDDESSLERWGGSKVDEKLSGDKKPVVVSSGTVWPEKLKQPETSSLDDGSPSSAATTSTGTAVGTAPTAFYRCRLCGYQDARHDKTKYHVVREHLHLGPYGCAYCPRYMWGRRHVARHISAVHPGMEVQIRRAFDEFETYLRENIRKIGGSAFRHANLMSSPSPPSSMPLLMSHLKEPSASVSPSSAVEPPKPPQSAPELPRDVPRKTMFKCGHCDFRDVLAARVQGHCLAKHPSKPVQYRRCDPEDNVARDSVSGLKIESVESLSAGKRLYASSTQSGFCEQDSFSEAKSARTQSMATEKWSNSECSSHVNSVNNRHVSVANDSSFAGDHLDKRKPPPAYCEQVNDSIPNSEEEDEYANNRDRDGDNFPTYVCRYCPEAAWSEDDIRAHLANVHPENPSQFGLVVKGAQKQGREETVKNSSETQRTEEFGVHNITKGKPPGGCFTGPIIYRCRLCHYRSDKVTVVRHHVMAHLLYHPYRCPYCDAARSVKSSPITKHIRGRHPGCDPSFICLRDEKLERQVRLNYYRSEPNETEDSMPLPPPISRRTIRAATSTANIPPPPPPPAPPSPPIDNIDQKVSIGRRPAKRILYRCKFCSLKTYVRTDMRHHLMREIGYKPFRCGHCAMNGSGGYAEPSRSAMGKHFRMRHAGMTIDVHDLSEPAQDAEVLKLLDSCAVDEGEELDELPSLTPLPVGKLSPQSIVPRSPGMSGSSGDLRKMVQGSSARVMVAGVAANGYTALMPAVKQHRSNVGSVKLRRCRHCSYSSPSAKALAQHVAVRHRPRRLRCVYCDHLTHYPSWMRKHSRKSHPNLPCKFVKVSSNPGSQHASASISSPSSCEIPPPSPELQPTLDEEQEQELDPEDMEAEHPMLAEEMTDSSKAAGGSSDGVGEVSILDGIEVHIPLIADSHGLFHCPDCTYQTSNRAHYKMHCMIHRPRKWKCLYCRLKFPLLFRLRHHYIMKHHGMPLKWIDLTTNTICDESTRLVAASSSTPSSATQAAKASLKSPEMIRSTARKSASGVRLSPVPTVQPTNVKATARKSTSRSALRVAMFRCGQYFSIRRCTALEDPPPSDEHIADGEDPAPSDEHIADDEDELNSDRDLASLPLASPVTQPAKIRLCCHLCNFVANELEDFVKHLQTDHPPSASSCPHIEILRPVEDSEMFLHRCGFCTYESFERADFEAHISSTHGFDTPLVCAVCEQFASLSESDVRRHFAAVHTDLPFDCKTLTQPYTMSASGTDESLLNDTACSKTASPYHMVPTIRLTNVLEIPRWELDVILNRHNVWFCS